MADRVYLAKKEWSKSKETLAGTIGSATKPDDQQQSTAAAAAGKGGLYFPKSKKKKKSQNIPDEKEPNMLEKIPTDASEVHESDSDDIDREWYNIDDAYDGPGAFLDSFESNPNPSNKMKSKTKPHQAQRKMGERARQFRADYMKWEESRMMASGAFENTNEQRVDFEDDADYSAKVHLLVHNKIPPFLDGRFAFTRLSQAVLPLKDPSSDMAKVCKEGSELIRILREQQERNKAQKKHWKLGGTKLGKLLGIANKDKIIADQNIETDDEIIENFKNSTNSEGKDDKKTSVSASKFNKIQKLRKSLPVYGVKQSFLNIIRDNNIVIVIGETGSGKTTQLTQYLYEDGYASRGIIACTQPRRVAAMSVAKRVADEFGCDIGQDVGYSIRFEDVTTPKLTKIKYMTDGIILREALKDNDLENYSAIIMDEAHERSLNTDILFGVLRNIIAKRNDLKLIVTSATMDAEKFSKFFGGVPIFTIPGRTFPVQTLFAKTTVQDYVDAAVKQAIQIHIGSEKSSGDILVFMPGQESIEVTCHFLQERLDKLEDIEPLLILPLFSQLPQDVQSKIFEKSSMRKCIVATNIAETSLTVDGIVYVIDTGYCKMKVFNPKLGMDSLQMFPISQANSKQRAGRAGRTKPGTCYHLYTMKQLNEDMLASPLPEIQRTNLSNVVLLLKSLGIEDLLSFHFMDPPPQENIMNSMYMLWLLGALSNTGDLTDLGRLMSEFPLDPAMAKLIIASAELGCAEDAIIICAMLSVPGIFYRPSGREDEADSAREKFTISESDHLTYLNVFKQWQAKGYSQYWCQQNFLHGKALKRAREVQLQLRLILNSLISHNKLHNHIKQSSSSSTQWDLLRQAICSAYFHNAAKTKGLAEYYGMRTGIKCQIHPTSSLYAMGCTADYVVFHELLLTSREFMQCVTEVDGEWLAKYGSILYSLKKTRTHGHNRVIDGQIVSGEDYNRSNESKIDLKLKEAEEELKRRKEEELLRERKINEKTKNKIISIHSKPRYLQR